MSLKNKIINLSKLSYKYNNINDKLSDKLNNELIFNQIK
jgi:hypothetical protein